MANFWIPPLGILSDAFTNQAVLRVRQRSRNAITEPAMIRVPEEKSCGHQLCWRYVVINQHLSHATYALSLFLTYLTLSLSLSLTLSLSMSLSRSKERTPPGQHTEAQEKRSNTREIPSPQQCKMVQTSLLQPRDNLPPIKIALALSIWHGILSQR